MVLCKFLTLLHSVVLNNRAHFWIDILLLRIGDTVGKKPDEIQPFACSRSSSSAESMLILHSILGHLIADERRTLFIE